MTRVTRACVCLLCVSRLAFSQEPLGDLPVSSTLMQPSALKEVKVVASRPRSLVAEIPSPVTILTREDFPDQGGVSTADVLAGHGQVGLLKYPAGAEEIRLRGFGTDSFPANTEISRVAVLIDGRPAGDVNLAKFPLDGLERIELVRGAGSALLGTSAMGGAVNLVSRRGSGSFSGRAALEGGDFEHRRAVAAFGGALGKVDYFLTGNRLTTGDYDYPGGTAPRNADRDEWNGAFNVGFSPLTGHRIGIVGYGYFGDRLSEPGSLSRPSDSRDVIRRRFVSGHVQYTGTWSVLHWDQMLYRSQKEDVFHSFRPRGSATATDSVTHYPGRYIGGRHLVTAEDARYGAVTGGVDWSDRKSESFNVSRTPFQPGSRVRNLAGLLEAKLKPPVVPVTFVAGVRRDGHNQDVTQPSQGVPVPGLTSQSRTWSVWTGRGGVVVDFGDEDRRFPWEIGETPLAALKAAKVRLHASAGSGFRAPVAHELTANYSTAWATYVGNPNLGPERSFQVDSGISWDVGLARGDFTWFRAVFKDKIDTMSLPTGEVTWKNFAGTILTGLEAMLEGELLLEGGLAARPFVNGTYHATMRNEDADEVLANETGLPLGQPRWIGSAGFSLGRNEGQRGGWSGKVAVSGFGAQRQVDFSSFSVVRLKSFAIWSVSARYWMSQRVEVYGRVDNFLNRRYAYILDYPMPATTAIGGIAVNF